jgi:hypothetical protein
MGISEANAASGSSAFASHHLGVNPPPSDERPSSHNRPDARTPQSAVMIADRVIENPRGVRLRPDERPRTR